MFLLVIPTGIYVRSLIIKEQINQLYVAAGFLVFTLYGFVNGLFTLIFVGPYGKQANKQLFEPISDLLCAWKRSYVVPALVRDSSVRPEDISHRRTM